MSTPRGIKCMGGPHDGQMQPYQGREIRFLPKKPLPRRIEDFAVVTHEKIVAESYRLQVFGHGRLGLHEERYVHSSLSDAQSLERMCDEWGAPE